MTTSMTDAGFLPLADRMRMKLNRIMRRVKRSFLSG